jgi:flagellar biosynthesis GTPase FlhF
MDVLQFIAPNAAAALEQIQKQLGPEAVVLSVRPLPAEGLAKLLPRKNRIEVLAGIPDKPAPSPSFTANQTFTPHGSRSGLSRSGNSTDLQSIGWLEAHGLLPEHAQRLQAHVKTLHGSGPFESLEAEWAGVSAALSHFWREPDPVSNGVQERPHVFIGPAGSGKSTVLCKWLTLSTLMEERVARVFRLDGSSANTADYLTIHCEMLGVPIERFWNTPANRAELLFVDLPGIDANDASALNSLRTQLAALPNPHVHLVLNAAYESSTLLAQCRGFAELEPCDLILTHLDEEPRRLKLWNFCFGSSLSIRFLSAGQKIPGQFLKATPELLFA